MSTISAPERPSTEAAPQLPPAPAPEAAPEARRFDPRVLAPLALVLPALVAFIVLRRRRNHAAALPRIRANKLEIEREFKFMSGNNVTFSPTFSPSASCAPVFGRRRR